MTKAICASILALILLSNPNAGKAQESELTSRIDSILSQTYKPGEPGAAALVIKNGKVVFRKSYGLAEVELGVPMEPDMVFHVGSVTKQFTAVCVLLLCEQGKLALTDDITRFLPDFPTNGRTITVEHLLTHTSGIRDLTDMPEFTPLLRTDLTPSELIDVFKNKPMDFAPGEQWKYSNSGYVLLGAIIEKVSGISYEEFLQKNIFDKLDMAHTCCGSASRIIPGRIPGYSLGKTGLENAPYLSMTLPYAGGCLLSSIDDLAIWNDALFSGKIVSRKTLAKAFLAFQLNNGESSRYGYGWFVSEYEGHRILEHGGGIHGFSSHVLTVPDNSLFVAVLTNSNIPGRLPESAAFRIIALALGKPYREPAAVVPDPEWLTNLAGVYQNRGNEDVRIFSESEKVFFQRPGGVKKEMVPCSGTDFFFKKSFIRVHSSGVRAMPYPV